MASDYDEFVRSLASGSDGYSGAALVTGGYIAKGGATPGSVANSSSWCRTPAIAVYPNTIITRTGNAVSTGSSAAEFAFFDAAGGFLGFANKDAPSSEIRVGDLFPLARTAIVSGTVAGNLAVTVRQSVQQDSVIGLPDTLGPIASLMLVDYFQRPVTAGYVTPAGLDVASSAWERALVPVVAGQRFRYTGRANSSVGNLAFYDTTKVFLSSSGSIASAIDLDVVVAVDGYLCASANPNYPRSLIGARPVAERNSPEALDAAIVASALIVDYFAAMPRSVGYYDMGGVFHAGQSWEMSDYVPCRKGQKFRLYGLGSGSAHSVVVFGADRSLLAGYGNIATPAGADFEITTEGAAFVRAISLKAEPHRFYGVQVGPVGAPESGLIVNAFNPEKVYGIQGEPVFIYGRNLCPDPSVELAFSVPRGNGDVLVMNTDPNDESGYYSAPGTYKVLARAIRGSATKIIADFDVIISGPPVNPPAMVNIIGGIGDSTTFQLEGAGTWVNEWARRLTGVGDPALPNGPAPFNLSNFRFLGTVGTGTRKTEGRSGWREYHYLNLPNDGSGKVNAFWDPALGRFSLEYYVRNNGYGVDVDPVNGVKPDGSNLLVPFWLGWNDAFKDDESSYPASTAAAEMGQLIDIVHTDMPAAKVLVIGLNPPPALLAKNNNPANDLRWYSRQDVFNVAILQFGEAYRDVTRTRANTDFLALAPQFDAVNGYNMATGPRGFRSPGVSVDLGVGDFVHCPAPGKANVADILTYYTINKFCQA